MLSARSFEIYFEMIAGSDQVGEEVMRELCQRVLNEKGMPDDLENHCGGTNLLRKKDVWNCRWFKGLKLLEHGMSMA